ncbi:MAG: LysR family transcriptional regulator [Spirochaetales bacterium]|nr:LysR family transcriptional regulator [Spirochaetales bacterium]
MLRLLDFEMLNELYDSKSITTASQKLYISQPALTKWLHKIEEDLGIIIVKRSVKGVVFTIEGQHLVRYGQTVLDGYRREIEELQGIQNNAQNTVSMMSAGSLTVHLLPKLLKSYKSINPNVNYHLRYAGSNITAKGIYEREADIGFIRGEPGLNLEMAEIRTEYATIISSEEIPLKKLPFLPRIDADLSESARLFINDWWQKMFDVSPNIAMKVPNIDTCIKMVKEGLGYSIIISSDVYEGVPGLHVYPLKHPNGDYVTRTDYMVWKADRYLSPCAKSFRDYAIDFFRSLPAKEPLSEQEVRNRTDQLLKP